MGVPKFYRWISERYPQINQMLSGTTILPEFDNFYLDMNGIIHACTHPNDNSTANSLTLREMMLAIFRYIDHMVTEIVKPKKILFMAIDGVAPRAKLNQQRARRFRAAQERQESIAKARQKGETVDEENLFDSNCITPGTEFMEQVGKHLRYFIRKKIKEDPLWRNLRIVFSGHDVPGEGEHKIMQFMRDLRAEPGYEPNQRHCMYGQDADLIMLGLATHEPHFALLREVVDFNANRGGGSARQTVLRQTKSASFQLLHLSILREYLSLDFAYECPWAPNQERLFDDFILLTFLVGNDFLPHLPSLDISEHAFDTLITAYRTLMVEQEGYIVHNGEIADLKRLEKLFALIGAQESSILKAREEDVKAFNQKRRKFKDANILSEEELEEAEEKLALAFETALNIAMGKDEGDEQDASGSEESSSEPGFSIDEYGNPVFPPEWKEVQKNMPTTVGAGKARKNGNGNGNKTKKSEEGEGEELEERKDYSGRYYYEKFQIVASSEKGQQFLSELMGHYLKGLMWCLAYYIKGCVSWTWYYPYHYGPMLKDMTDLEAKSERITFELGQPFMPFQQLLGCLPPASCTLLPRPYQWLMISVDSPVLHFYPVDFGIDQDGKKNPWEAVVLLDFIDEKALMAAEALHCPTTKLTKAEYARNQFGNVLTHLYDPGMVETYPSCNPEIGLPDIPSCQSVVTESYPSLAPGVSFKAELVPGTVYPIAGYPSLTILPLQGMRIEAAKVNMFGSESKYKSMILEIKSPQIENVDSLNAELLLGRVVYVNYPQIHEAKVLAVTTAKEEVRLVNGLPKRTVHDHAAARQWAQESEEEEEKYFKGRGTPGSGGLRIGTVVVRLRVAALQGLHRDPTTGASRKTFSSKEEADVPIQMALWTPPVPDTRFEETAELTIEELMPHGAEVVALTGELMGVKGRIVGPHNAEDPSAPATAGKRGSLKSDIRKDQIGVAGGAAPKKRVVDVEFTLYPPEPPFGYSIANSIKEEYYTSKDLCALLQITPSVLGKIVGMVRVDPGRADLGLNLKRNGQYQLLGYSQRVDYANNGDSSAEHFRKRKVWGGVDTVEIVGMVSNDNAAANKAAEADAASWQYSARAAALIYDYKTSFPYLFHQLERLPHQPAYTPDALLGAGGEKKLEQVQEWLKSQPFFKLPRTPFTTSSLPKDAMAAIERAADVQTSKRAACTETKTITVKGVPVEHVFCAVHRGVGDVALTYNQLEPKLGDRVVNLTCPGVPFGFKGTVVTIHSSTKFVELIFDEEFIGGKGLQGSCSQFRGRLAPWSDLLLVSRSDEFQDFKKGGGKGGKNAAKPAWTTTAPVVSPTGKKSTASETPPAVAAAGSHPVKQVLQRPAHAVASPPAKASYASAAVSMDSHGKPVLKQDTGASVGQKLLKALQKEDKDKPASVISPASKVAILKKKIGIPDQPAASSSSASAAPVSNGTGVNILAEAAGFSVSDIGKDETLLPSSFSLLPHHPMMGVISYQAQQASALNKSSLTTAPVLPTPPTATAAAGASHSVHPPHAPPRVLGAKHASPQKQRPATAAAPSSQHQPTSKLVLNKEATRRIVTHELKPNGPTPAGGEKKKAADSHAQDVHATPEQSSVVSHGKTAAGATLLATMKKNQDKKPVSEAKTSTTVEPTVPTTADAAANPAAAVVTAPLTMAEKLANAKKAMKEKQAKMALLKKSADAAEHAPSAPATVTSPSQAIKKTASGEHKKEKEVKKEDSHEKKSAAPSIVSILTKAKQAAATSSSAEKEKPVHAHTAAPAAAAAHVHAAPAGIHAPEPHHAPAKVSVVHKGTAAHAPATTAKGDATAGASITDMLKNAKRATPSSDSSTSAPAPVPAPAAASHAVSPTAALKRKAPSSLVPSKVIITKSK